MEIPKTIEQATERLNGIEALLTKAGWARAAIVSAFVRLNEFGSNQHSEGVSSDTLTLNQFAALGISGLKSKNTVQHYVEQWLETHDGKYPAPGEVISDEHILSLGDFPRSRQERGNTQQELVQSAARGGTLVGLLTDEQKTEVVSSIAKEQGAEKVVAAFTEEQKTEVAREVIKQAEPTIVHEVTKSARERYDDDHEKFAAARKAAAERQEAERKQAHSLRYIQVEGLLDGARRKLRDALTEAQNVSFTEEENALLVEDIQSLRTLVDLFTALLTGSTEVDWDAELQKMEA